MNAQNIKPQTKNILQEYLLMNICGGVGGGGVCENIFKILFTKHHQDIVLDTKFMI